MLTDINFKVTPCLVRTEHSLSALHTPAFEGLSCVRSQKYSKGEHAKGSPHSIQCIDWFYSSVSSLPCRAVPCHVTRLCSCHRIPGWCVLREDGLILLLVCRCTVYQSREGAAAAAQWLGFLDSSDLSAQEADDGEW